jgi:PAS domain S-box
VTLERQHRAKDGHVFPVEIHTSVFEYDGKSGSISLSRDIPERKRAQAELQRLNKTLEQPVGEELAKNRGKDHLLIQQSRLAAMGEMVHNIAHQWRQPINVLGILLSNLQDSYDYGELAERGAARKGVEGQTGSMDRCLHEVEGILGASLSHRDIELTDGIDEAVCADGYSNEFSQALLNVITNAKEAIVSTRREGGRIRMRAAERDGMIEVRVADNGGGIPEDVRPKIFDPYFTTKDKGAPT